MGNEKGMRTLQEVQQDAKEKYATANVTGKRLLELIFGKELFVIPLTQIVQDFSTLCAAGKVNEKSYAIPAKGTYKQKADMYMERLMLGETVFNQGEIIDFANTAQDKYYPYFKIIPDKTAPAGFRLSFRGCYCALTFAYLGARPHFIREKYAIHFGKTFIAEYEAYLQNYQLSKTNP